MADVRLGDAVTTGRPSRRILAVLVIELLVLIASLIAVVALSSSDKSGSGSSSADQDRTAAVAAAEQFTQNVQAYPPFNGAGYQAHVLPMLTTKAKAAAATQLQAYQPVLAYYRKICASAKGQAAQICKAYEAKPQVSIAFAAVVAINASSATVLVPHLVTYVAGGNSQKYEFQVTLDKVGGKWLVDTYCTANIVTNSTNTATANSPGCASQN